MKLITKDAVNIEGHMENNTKSYMGPSKKYRKRLKYKLTLIRPEAKDE